MELTSLHLPRYGKMGHKHGLPPKPDQCCVEITHYVGRWPEWSQCSKKRGHGPEGAYCATHDPEKVAARQRKQGAKYAQDAA